jgi:hypothetical protein
MSSPDKHDDPCRGLLRSLPLAVRLGLSGLVLTLLIGMAASAAHLYMHTQNRDESAGLTIDDVKAAYHGLDKPSPLVTALERGHPEMGLGTDDRATLLKWLKSGRIAEDYDSIDLGASTPNEIVSGSCLSCHSASSTGPTASPLRLDSAEAIRRLAFPKKVNRTPVGVAAMSTHTHALSLGALSLTILAALWLTRLPRGLTSILVALNGLSLFADIAAWWLAREHEGFVYLITAAGAVYNVTTILVILLVLADLWWPRRLAAAAVPR